MEQSDKLILKSFLKSSIPYDFEFTPTRMLMVETFMGLADSAYHGKRMSKDEILAYDLDNETKKDIASILSNDLDNLKFYYLLKLVIIVLHKYAY